MRLPVGDRIEGLDGTVFKYLNRSARFNRTPQELLDEVACSAVAANQCN